MSGFDRWIGKVAIVTGASRGIGANIAERLVKEGLQVAGLARRIHRLETLSQKVSSFKGKFHSIKCDISNESDIKSAFEWVEVNLGAVHILINAAGILNFTNLIDGKTEKWREMFNVNVFGILISTREAVKVMRENNIDGHIVNINSIAGQYPVYIENFNVYSATKHCVRVLSENYRKEFNAYKLKIKITSVSPGLVDTEMPQQDFLKILDNLNVEDVTDVVMFALSTKPHVQIPEIMLRPVGEEF